MVIPVDLDTGSPVARARDAARKLPDAQLVVVPDAGHWVQRDRPDIVLPATTAYEREDIGYSTREALIVAMKPFVPAPAEARSSRTVSVKPSARPLPLGSSLNDRCVLATHTGR